MAKRGRRKRKPDVLKSASGPGRPVDEEGILHDTALILPNGGVALLC